MNPIRFLREIAARLVPVEWRDSIAGDLEEERARRRARGQYAGRLWAAAASAAIVLSLIAERRRGAPVDRTRRVGAVLPDLRAVTRSLLARPGYTAVVVLTLALGIGANASLFTFANWLLFRPIPGVADPGTLVTIGFGDAEGTRLPVSIPDITRLAAAPGIRDLTGYHTTSAHVAAPAAGARRVYADVVSARYFDVLGAPAQGRGFTEAEGTQSSAPPVVVISDRLWRRDFDGDPALLGRTIVVNRTPVTVIGIAAPGFHGGSLTASSDLFIPVAQHALALPWYPTQTLTSRRVGIMMGLFARVDAGIDPAALAAQLEVVRAQLAAENPADARIGRWRYQVETGVEAHQWQRGQLRDAFVLLGIMAALLLLLTCANAGQLMVARTIARRTELATRLALGASRGRLARLLLAETGGVTAIAAVAAIIVALFVARIAEGTTLLQSMPPVDRPAMDWRVLGAALGLSAVVAAIAGVFPLLGIGRVDVSQAIRDVSRSQTASRTGLRRALAAVQVVLSLALVIGALLLSRSIASKLSVDPGFDPSRVLTFSIDPGIQRNGDTRPGLFAELLDRVRATPGVRSATVAWLRPSFQGVGSDTSFRPDGAPADSPTFDADTNRVAPGYFDAIGLPIVAGRDFSDSESGPLASTACTCVVITESLARRAFAGEPAVGRQILRPQLPAATVIGVVRDTRQRNLLTGSADMVFEPLVPGPGIGFASIIVGLHSTSDDVAPRLARAVGEVDPTLPIYDLQRVDTAIRAQFADDRLLALLARVFAALATVVASIGLAGVLGRLLAERRREFGIRLALGATPRRIVRLVAKEAAFVFAIGVPIGLAASWWLSGLLRAQLFGVDRADVLSFAGGILIVAAVILVCATPIVRRASRLAPTLAMRD